MVRRVALEKYHHCGTKRLSVDSRDTCVLCLRENHVMELHITFTAQSYAFLLGSSPIMFSESFSQEKYV